MNTAFFVLLILFNVAISYWNARTIGPVWRDRHKMGWGLWLVTWSAVIQSAIGFSMPILCIEMFSASALFAMPAAFAKLTAQIWYLLVIVPVIGTAIVITVDSWIEAWRRRDFVSAGVAGYNTFATASNVSGSGSGIMDAFSGIGDAISSDDEGGGLVLLAILLAVVALFSGGLITYAVLDAHKP